MAKKAIFHHIPIVNMLAVRPRLVVAVLVAVAVFLWLPEGWRMVTRLLMAWDAGAFSFLIFIGTMMATSDDKKIKRRSASQDQGSLVLLGLTVFGAVASVVAIMSELAAAKNEPQHVISAVALAAATVVLSWLFVQTIFALHYAHEYYSPGSDNETGGLEFPAHFKAPDYWDFIYFSFVIGTAAATADINLTSRVMRRIVTLHCTLVFFFNTSILALAVNVGASLAS